MPTRAILRTIESLGYAVSVHRMGEYIELHAVLLRDPESMMYIARNGDGDGPEEEYCAACELARMVGVDVEDG